MATLGEIAEALSVIRKYNKNIMLLQCTSEYPAKLEDVNLRAMETLRNKFRVPIGYSDHTTGILIACAAVALGACVIEKHFTLNKKLPGPDHRASIEPYELAKMVKDIKKIEMALGSGRKVPSQDELEIAKVARKSIVAKVMIKKGERIVKDMLKISRPGTGLPPSHIERIVGKIALADIREDEVITGKKVGLRS